MTLSNLRLSSTNASLQVSFSIDGLGKAGFCPRAIYVCVNNRLQRRQQYCFAQRSARRIAKGERQIQQMGKSGC